MNIFLICLLQVVADFKGQLIRNIAAEDPLTFAHSNTIATIPTFANYRFNAGIFFL